MNSKTLFAGLFLGSALIAGPAFAAEGPYTQAQLDKGKQEYNGHCRECHAKDGKGALGPALQGEVFKTRWKDATIADVRNWIHQNMPQNAPGSLKDEQLNPIMAYILSLNGFTPGQTEMSADAGKDAKVIQ